MDLGEEEIRPAEGFDGYYVDRKGNVYSSWKRGPHSKKIFNLRKVKSSPMNKYGHLIVNLRVGEKKYKNAYVHILVLTAFVGPRPEGAIACHGSKGTNDNSVNNLSWGSWEKNNGIDKLRDGTHNRGEKCGQAKLVESDIKIIRKLAAEKFKHKEIASIFGIHKATVSWIVTRRSWSWLKN